MSQRNLQIIVIAVSVGLFAFLYFGIRTKPLERSKIEKTRALKAEGSTDTEKLIASAKAELNEEQLAPILKIEATLPLQLTDSLRAESFKSLSSAWYAANKFSISGIYAKNVAETLNTEESWSIAGTTFGAGQRGEKSPETKKFCIDQAIECFKKATEINPTKTEHKINLALIYVETEQPMQGIAMLRDLSQKEPNNTAVLMALGQLSIRSGQYDKALQRYQQVIELEPNNLRGHYALGQVYQSTGKIDEAIAEYNKCVSLSDDSNFKSDMQQVIKKLKSN